MTLRGCEIVKLPGNLEFTRYRLPLETAVGTTVKAVGMVTIRAEETMGSQVLSGVTLVITGNQPWLSLVTMPVKP